MQHLRWPSFAWINIQKYHNQISQDLVHFLLTRIDCALTSVMNVVVHWLFKFFASTISSSTKSCNTYRIVRCTTRFEMAVLRYRELKVSTRFGAFLAWDPQSSIFDSSCTLCFLWIMRRRIFYDYGGTKKLLKLRQILIIFFFT